MNAWTRDLPIKMTIAALVVASLMNSVLLHRSHA